MRHLSLLGLVALTSIAVSFDARAETLTVALAEGGYPPFYFAKPQEPPGIYAEILQAVSKQTADEYKFLVVPQLRKFSMFAAGTVDVEPGVNPEWRQEWQSISLYSVSFGISRDLMVFRQGEARKGLAPKDYKGLTIGCVVGYHYDAPFEALLAGGNAKRDESDTEDTLLKKLGRRRIDAGVINETVGRYLVKANGYAAEFGETIGEVPLHFRFHQRRAAALKRFDAALTALVKDGAVERIFAKYR